MPPWVGTELGAAAPSLARGQQHSKRSGGRMVLAASQAGPCAAARARGDMPRWEAAQAMHGHTPPGASRVQEVEMWRCLAGLVLF